MKFLERLIFSKNYKRILKQYNQQLIKENNKLKEYHQQLEEELEDLIIENEKLRELISELDKLTIGE